MTTRALIFNPRKGTEMDLDENPRKKSRKKARKTTSNPGKKSRKKARKTTSNPGRPRSRGRRKSRSNPRPMKAYRRRRANAGGSRMPTFGAYALAGLGGVTVRAMDWGVQKIPVSVPMQLGIRAVASIVPAILYGAVAKSPSMALGAAGASGFVMVDIAERGYAYMQAEKVKPKDKATTETKKGLGTLSPHQGAAAARFARAVGAR